MGHILFAKDYVDEIDRAWSESTSKLSEGQYDVLYFIFIYVTAAFKEDFDLIRRDLPYDICFDYSFSEADGNLRVEVGYHGYCHFQEFTDDQITTFMSNKPDINRAFIANMVRSALAASERYSEPDFDTTTIAHQMFMKQVKDFKLLLETDQKFKNWFENLPTGGEK